MPAQYRHAPGRGGVGEAAQDTTREGGVAGADRVEEPDGGRTHGREVVEVHQHAAPPRPLRVALDHGGQDRVAGGDHLAARHRCGVVADEAARVHDQVRVAVPQGLVAHAPPQPLEEPAVLGLDLGVEAQRALGLGPGAGRAHQRGTDPEVQPRVGRDRQPAAPPPAQVAQRRRAVGRRRRVDADPTEQLAVAGQRHEHHGAGVVVDDVGVGAGEESLLGDEDVVPQPPVAGQLVRPGLHDDVRRVADGLHAQRVGVTGGVVEGTGEPLERGEAPDLLAAGGHRVVVEVEGAHRVQVGLHVVHLEGGGHAVAGVSSHGHVWGVFLASGASGVQVGAVAGLSRPRPPSAAR